MLHFDKMHLERFYEKAESKQHQEKERLKVNRRKNLSCSLLLPPQPKNIYASAFCPDRVMDSRGDFAWA